MEKTFKKYKVDWHTYYLAEKGDIVALINSESYHEPIEKFLNKRFCYYIYEKRQDREIKDYVYSYDYETYEILPTLKECKKNVEQFYFNK